MNLLPLRERLGDRGQCRPPSAAKGRAAFSPAAWPKRLASVACLLRGPHDLADEALWSPDPLVVVTDTAGARVKGRGHRFESCRARHFSTAPE